MNEGKFAPILREIEDQATRAWKLDSDIPGQATALTAWDFLKVNLRTHEVGENWEAEISSINLS